MASTDSYYVAPQLRPGVQAVVGARSASFRYYKTEFDVEYDPSVASVVAGWVADLRKGAKLQLAATPSELASYYSALLDTMDRYGFLTESAPVAAEIGKPGRLFWGDLAALALEKKAALPFLFSKALAGHTATREMLLCYALQYYHVVSHGPLIIAGALAQARSREAQLRLDAFYLEERNHDQLLLDSLKCVGVDVFSKENGGLIPEAFNLISHLHVLADHDPLSFAGTIFLMEEENPEFHKHFVDNCDRLHFAKGFWEPIVKHSDVNVGGDHGSISCELLSLHENLTDEERIVVKKHLVTMLEMISALDCAIYHAK